MYNFHVTEQRAARPGRRAGARSGYGASAGGAGCAHCTGSSWPPESKQRRRVAQPSPGPRLTPAEQGHRSHRPDPLPPQVDAGAWEPAPGGAGWIPSRAGCLDNVLTCSSAGCRCSLHPGCPSCCSWLRPGPAGAGASSSLLGTARAWRGLRLIFRRGWTHMMDAWRTPGMLPHLQDRATAGDLCGSGMGLAQGSWPAAGGGAGAGSAPTAGDSLPGGPRCPSGFEPPPAGRFARYGSPLPAPAPDGLSLRSCARGLCSRCPPRPGALLPGPSGGVTLHSALEALIEFPVCICLLYPGSRCLAALFSCLMPGGSARLCLCPETHGRHLPGGAGAGCCLGDTLPIAVAVAAKPVSPTSPAPASP